MGTNISLEGMTRLQIYYGWVGFFQRVLERKPIHRGFNEWKHCCVDDFPNVMGLNQNYLLSFEIASLMCCQLDYALKLSHGSWLVLPVKVAALRCVPCAVCCVLPRSCVQPAIGPTHVAELASWKWPSFQKEVMRLNCFGKNNITDGVISTLLEGFCVFFCFLCGNLSMILITEKMIKLF